MGKNHFDDIVKLAKENNEEGLKKLLQDKDISINQYQIGTFISPTMQLASEGNIKAITLLQQYGASPAQTSIGLGLAAMRHQIAKPSPNNDFDTNLHVNPSTKVEYYVLTNPNQLNVLCKDDQFKILAILAYLKYKIIPFKEILNLASYPPIVENFLKTLKQGPVAQKFCNQLSQQVAALIPNKNQESYQSLADIVTIFSTKPYGTYPDTTAIARGYAMNPNYTTTEDIDNAIERYKSFITIPLGRVKTTKTDFSSTNIYPAIAEGLATAGKIDLFKLFLEKNPDILKKENVEKIATAFATRGDISSLKELLSPNKETFWADSTLTLSIAIGLIIGEHNTILEQFLNNNKKHLDPIWTAQLAQALAMQGDIVALRKENLLPNQKEAFWNSQEKEMTEAIKTGFQQSSWITFLHAYEKDQTEIKEKDKNPVTSGKEEMTPTPPANVPPSSATSPSNDAIIMRLKQLLENEQTSNNNQEAIKKLTSELKAEKDKQQLTEKEKQALEQQLREAEEIKDHYKKQFIETQQTLQQKEEEIKNLKTSLVELEAKITQLTGEKEALNKKDVSPQLKILRQNISDVSKQYNKTTTSLQTLVENFNQIGETLKLIQSNTPGYRQPSPPADTSTSSPQPISTTTTLPSNPDYTPSQIGTQEDNRRQIQQPLSPTATTTSTTSSTTPTSNIPSFLPPVPPNLVNSDAISIISQNSKKRKIPDTNNKKPSPKFPSSSQIVVINPQSTTATSTTSTTNTLPPASNPPTVNRNLATTSVGTSTGGIFSTTTNPPGNNKSAPVLQKKS